MHTIEEVRPLINTLHVLWSVMTLDEFNWIDAIQSLPDDYEMNDRQVAYLMNMKRRYYKPQPYHPEWDYLAATMEEVDE